MNDLIAKLYDQAIVLQSEGDYVAGELDAQKFAELIIKACLEQVHDEVQYEHDWKLADAVSKRVLKHFGVEE